MRSRIKEITNSILNILQLIGLEKWRENGFTDLEKLIFSVEAAVSEESDIVAYHRLAWLRTWLFWVDLRRTTTGDEQMALSAHFYSLVLVIVPLFPVKYSEGLIEICLKRIEGACKAVNNEKFGLEELLDSARKNAWRMVREEPEIGLETGAETRNERDLCSSEHPRPLVISL